MAERKLPVLALLALLFVACPAEISGSTVLTVAANNGASMFASLVGKCAYLEKLLTTSTRPNSFTVFAFSDKAYERSPAAFKKLVNDTQYLQWALEYHVAFGLTTSQDIKDNLLITSLYASSTIGDSLDPQYIRTNVYSILAERRKNIAAGFGKTVTASGAPIIVVDKVADNGIVHILDKVMFPIPTGANVPQFVQNDSRFSTLLAFLQKANLTGALQTDPSKPLTVFAPNNDAFKNLPKDVVKQLSNVTVLQHVLEYHVVSGAYYAAGLYDNQQLLTLFGKNLLVQRGPGGVFVQDSKVIQADNTVTNGVVHEISAVMLPPK